jgi:hypothetical protein
MMCCLISQSKEPINYYGEFFTNAIEYYRAWEKFLSNKGIKIDTMNKISQNYRNSFIDIILSDNQILQDVEYDHESIEYLSDRFENIFKTISK